MGRKKPNYRRKLEKKKRNHVWVTNVSRADDGSKDCLISFQVSWARKKNNDVALLTVATEVYSTDKRISLEFAEPNNWRLHIKSVKLIDSGNYVCEVSSHPPMELSFHVHIVGKVYIYYI
jgi:hypothetical protein